MDATNAALACIRVATYALFAWIVFFFVAIFSSWWSDDVQNEQEPFSIKLGGTEVYSFLNEVITYTTGIFVVVAILGGVYEYLWKRKEFERDGEGHFFSKDHQSSSLWTKIRAMTGYQLRPLGKYSPWFSVGEIFCIFIWVASLSAMMGWSVHGNHKDYLKYAMPCESSPSKYCWGGLEESPAPTRNEYRFEMAALFFGFVASHNFAVILIPVSRDSTLLAAAGVPYERAVLYHTIAGHLAFTGLLFHGLLYIAYWAWTGGWSLIVEESIHHPHDKGSINIPMGWMAFLCAVPMWVTSVNYVRRKWYSLFKASHWLFIGVFLFGAMHWDGNVAYFVGGIALYTLHVVSRLEGWKRWRYWNRWSAPSPALPATSVVDVKTTHNYTRLVLRNPKASVPRGGMFAYLSAPGAMGTDEAHPFTVALRGWPPTLCGDSSGKGQLPATEVFTVYIKSLGSWSAALRAAASGAEAAYKPETLLVDADGFYGHLESYTSIRNAQAERIMIFAGGAGMTSFMGHVQDWSYAASMGVDVPRIHLAWCCRDLEEFALVGEALPSLIAVAESRGRACFTLSLYCTAKGGLHADPSVEWPSSTVTSSHNEASRAALLSKQSANASLTEAARALVVGASAYAGYLMGFHEAYRRKFTSTYQEGAILLALTITFALGGLLIYGWLLHLLQRFIGKPASTFESKVGEDHSESKTNDMEAFTASMSAPVTAGRTPVRDILQRANRDAEGDGIEKIKVLVSGPNALVDVVMSETRAINWKLFEAEVYSFEF